MNLFSPDMLDMHNTDDQLEQQVALSYLKIQQADNGSWLVTETDDDGIAHQYHPSLDSCDCDYFTANHLPCRHMYRVAIKENLFKAVRTKRSDKLIADFSNGYAAGWKFIVRPCNWQDLDILYTPRRKNKQVFYVWTQGKCYSFTSGSVFYDTMKAYKMPWGEALKHITCSLQIKESLPTGIVSQVAVEKGILVNRTHYEYGTIKFDLYRPDQQREHEHVIGHYSCQQDEFVKLLKSGTFTDTEGKRHDFFKEV